MPLPHLPLLLPLAPPPFPEVRWPVAARLVPAIQDVAKGVYEGAYFLGAADGLAWGLAIGAVLGAVGACACGSLVYWAFFRPVR